MDTTAPPRRRSILAAAATLVPMVRVGLRRVKIVVGLPGWVSLVYSVWREISWLESLCWTLHLGG